MSVRVSLLLLMTLLFTVPMYAQPGTTLSCGQNISGQFVADGDKHLYPIFVNGGTQVIAHVDSLPLDEEPSPLSVEVVDANAFVLASKSLIPDETATVETETLQRSGVYDVSVQGEAGTVYQLLVSCVEPTGEVRTDNNGVQPLLCGQTVENTALEAESVHRYYVRANANDEITLNVTTVEVSTGDTPQVEALAPAPFESDVNNQTFAMRAPTAGTYVFYVLASDATYQVAASCVFTTGERVSADADQTIVLEPTELDPPSLDMVVPFAAQANNAPPIVASTVQDIEIPLLLGTPNTGVITLDFVGVYAYHFEAAAGEMFALELERVSGNKNLGVVVASDLQPILFDASLITSDTLYTEFTAPDAGQYAIRIAELDIVPQGIPEPTVFSVMVSPTG